MDYMQWSAESHQIAIDVAYKGIELGQVPSSEYFSLGENIALRQIALSGYRLAALINEIFKN